MQELYDFLSFKTFISPYMLFIFYYLGAVFVPYLCFKYSKKFYLYFHSSVEEILAHEYKFKIFLLSIGMFLFLEILWRMMFEYLLAFLQIRDALVL